MYRFGRAAIRALAARMQTSFSDLFLPPSNLAHSSELIAFFELDDSLSAV